MRLPGCEKWPCNAPSTKDGAETVDLVALENVAEPAVNAKPGDPLLSELLRKLVATLPEAPRMVMVLRYQEDLEPTEIAAALEMPVATVKSHLQRSLALLREKLARRGIGERETGWTG